MPAASQSLDYSALSRKVTYSQVTKHKEFWYIPPLVIIGFVSIGFTYAALLYTGITGAFAVATFGIVMLLFAAAAYRWIVNKIRMIEFAQANGMTYSANLAYDNRPGVIFHEGNSKKFREILSSTKHAFSEMGTYEYTTGSGKNRTIHAFGFVKIKLPRKLPNIVLDSKKNNFLGKISNLPSGMSGNQKLSLEGDFDSYFTLYTPKQYERDALYIFTPDVMQAIVDAAQDYDCEVIDDTFYLYSKTPLDLKKPKQIQEMLNITGKLRAELTAQTDYYADDRVGDRALNTVATPGVRLKRRLSVLQIIAIVIAIIILAFNFLPLLFAMFNIAFN